MIIWFYNKEFWDSPSIQADSCFCHSRLLWVVARIYILIHSSIVSFLFCNPQFSLCCAGLYLFCRMAKHSNPKRNLPILNQTVCQRGKSWNNIPLHRSQTCGNHLRKEAMKAKARPATVTRALKYYSCLLACKK